MFESTRNYSSTACLGESYSEANKVTLSNKVHFCSYQGIDFQENELKSGKCPHNCLGCSRNLETRYRR
jgi:hypothetical protein